MATVLTNLARSIVTGLLAASNVRYMAWGTGAGTAAATDTTLFTEASETRVAGTQTQQQTTTNNDTYQVVATITCAGSGKTITNAGIFDAATSGSLYMKGDFTGVALNVGEGIQFTCRAAYS